MGKMVKKINDINETHSGNEISNTWEITRMKWFTQKCTVTTNQNKKHTEISLAQFHIEKLK